jgi:hypothetical protein
MIFRKWPGEERGLTMLGLGAAGGAGAFAIVMLTAEPQAPQAPPSNISAFSPNPRALRRSGRRRITG